MATTTTAAPPTGVKLAPGSILSPPPADITIAQAATPLHIDEIAAMMGLETGEWDLYGPHQAKVRNRKRERAEIGARALSTRPSHSSSL